MKKLSYYMFAIISIVTVACKKDVAVNPEPLLASVNVINAATDDYAVFVNPFASGLSYSRLNTQNNPLYLGNSYIYGIPSGSVSLKVVSATDTLKTFYSAMVNLEPLKMYSLFVAGNAATRENILVADDVIPRYTDSAIAVRVINLSVDGPSINLALSGSNLSTNIAYKAKSDFKKVSLNQQQEINGLTFDIVSSTTGLVLTSYNLGQYGYPISTTSARFKSLTLVVLGSVNGAPFSSNAYRVFAVPNY